MADRISCLSTPVNLETAEKMSMQSVLVFGATGATGSSIAEALLASNKFVSISRLVFVVPK